MTEVQQLKGSCPFLYAFDGERWRFVTDALGHRAPPVSSTTACARLRPTRASGWSCAGARCCLRREAHASTSPRSSGRRRTSTMAELARRGPSGRGRDSCRTSGWCPRRFPEKRLFTVARPDNAPARPTSAARDRTREIAREDGVYLARLRSPTRYQGIVAPHDLVLDPPRAAPARTVMLYLTGWIFYADTSINVSLSQGKRDLAPPVLEVPDGRGGWKVGDAGDGLSGRQDQDDAARSRPSVLDRRDPRVRIRTNLAISLGSHRLHGGRGAAPTVVDRGATRSRAASSSAASRGCARDAGRAAGLPARRRRPGAALGRHGRPLHAVRRRARSPWPRPTTATSS